MKEISIDSGGARITAGIVPYGDLDDEFVRQWEELEDRSARGNAYLSPNFILPAVKHLAHRTPPSFLAVRRADGNGTAMIGLGIFDLSPGSVKFPLPHLKAYRTPHSYLGGLLTDGEHGKAAVDAFLAFVRRAKSVYGAEYVDLVENADPGSDLSDACRSAGAKRCMEYRKQRPILVPGNVGSGYLESVLSKRRMKTFRRNMNLMSKQGEVRWDATLVSRSDPSPVDRFLELEHMGWKGERGTSLRSNPGDERFFREMIGNFSKRGRAFFTELSVGGEVISSTSNLISSRAGFAFKIGWNPRFAAASPGVMNELEFIRRIAFLFPYLEYIDSGAEEGSYLEELWPDRVTLVSGFLASKPLSRGVMNAMDSARRWKNALPSLRSRKGEPH